MQVFWQQAAYDTVPNFQFSLLLHALQILGILVLFCVLNPAGTAPLDALE